MYELQERIQSHQLKANQILTGDRLGQYPGRKGGWGGGGAVSRNGRMLSPLRMSA